MKTRTLLFASIGCIFTGAVSAQDADYSFKETYKVSLPAQMAISTSDGNIEVMPAEGNEIQVFYIARKYNKVLMISRVELEKEFIVEVSHNGDKLEIAVKHRERSSSWLANFKDRTEVGFRILAPGRTACDLRTSDGNIAFSGLTGEQQCRTSDGNIRIADMAGNVSGHTSDGNIAVTNVKGMVDVKTSDGNINLEDITGNVLSKTSDGDIRLKNISGNVQSVTSDGNIQVSGANGDAAVKTSDGDISFSEITGSIEAVTSDGNVRGQLRELKKQLTVRTSDGNIHVTVPDNLGMDLNIKGESLNVPLKNFSGKSDKEYIQGKSNGGGIAVNLHTSSGNVTLDYR